MQTSRVSSDIVLDNLELHSEEGCPVLEDVEVPKVLGDVVESLMGAIYLDSGKTFLPAVKKTLTIRDFL